MSEIKLTVSTERLAANLRRIMAEQPKVLGAALYQEGEAIMAESKQLVPVDLGNLRDSGHVQQPVITGDSVTVKLGYGGPAAAYALYVHEGTGPAVGRPAYWPPKAALEGWARSHGFDNVFLVQWAIHEHGTKPKKYLETPFKAHAAGLRNRIAEKVAQALR